ncbi:MAG TPA: ATP-binding protein, partial [Candidatus Dormibacteraeota bacterium]|nr:ATP-binding protein [Candidatus Dormibacteraeota bacterium]
FHSRMSHELRTPLTAILGFTELLSMDELGDPAREWVSVIERAGQHLLDLVNDILDISRVQEGDPRVALEPVPLRSVLEEALQIVGPLASAGEVTLRPPALSQTTRYVRGDGQRLKQVLLNLLSNAVKYNRRPGEVTISVGVPAPGRARISVTDTGPGIDEAGLRRLFVPFERLDAARRGIAGTGLGLALSRELARTMGGDVGVESTVGVGSTFWVELADVEPAAVHVADVSRESGPGRRACARPVRILYIEDTMTNITLVEGALSLRPGVTVIPAMLGGVGLDLSREHRPDLVLLDTHLPDMPGEEVLRRLRAEPRTADVPVVVLSADATPAQMQRMRDAGAVEYLTKPIGVRRLLAAVDATLSDLSALEEAAAT